MVEDVDIACEGRVAEWFKAAVLKTAVAPVTKSEDLAENSAISIPSPGDHDAKFAPFQENESGSARHDSRHSLFALSPLPQIRGAA